MPEGEKRIEFHAHTNMSTRCSSRSGGIDLTAAKWGHQAEVAITDHGECAEFSAWL